MIFKTEDCALIFLISCGAPKFSYDKDFCNVGICISITLFEESLSKSLASSSEGSKISLSEGLG